MSVLQKNTILIVLAVVIAVAPLVLLKEAPFAGADDLAESAVKEIDPNYTPWFQPLFELPSGEVESLLFSVQAALGTGIMGFILGRMTAKPQKEQQNAGN